MPVLPVMRPGLRRGGGLRRGCGGGGGLRRGGGLRLRPAGELLILREVRPRLLDALVARLIEAHRVVLGDELLEVGDELRERGVVEDPEGGLPQLRPGLFPQRVDLIAVGAGTLLQDGDRDFEIGEVHRRQLLEGERFHRHPQEGDGEDGGLAQRGVGRADLALPDLEDSELVLARGVEDRPGAVFEDGAFGQLDDALLVDVDLEGTGVETDQEHADSHSFPTRE